MKSIKYLFLALIATVMVGCTEDTTFEPGPVDTNTDCAALYFGDDQPTYFSFDKENDVLEIDIVVCRGGDTSVASVHTIDFASGDADIFSFDSIEFSAGQAETIVKLSFPNAVEGETYSVTACIETEDSPIYSSNNISYAMTIFIDYPWVPYVGPNGETTGYWTEGIMGGIFSGVTVSTKEVEVWYTEGIEGLYRIENIYTADFTSLLWGCTEEEEYGYAIEPTTLTAPIYTYIHAEDPDAVWIEFHNSGYYMGASYGYFMYGSYVPDNSDNLAAAGSSYTAGSEDNYGTNTDGYMFFNSDSFITGLSAYSIGWYGSDLTLLLPGAEAALPQEWVDFELTSGEYVMTGEGNSNGTTEETITIEYDSTLESDNVTVYGLFYGYTSATVTGTYDAETQTISIPDWQDLGIVSGYDVYFANYSGVDDIVFTLNRDATGFETSQYWGYYVDNYSGWWEIYLSATITEPVNGGITSFVNATYTLNGYSYFDDCYYTEDVTIYFDSANSKAYLQGLFYGYSDAMIVGSYDSAAGTISIPDWQNFGAFNFSSGAAEVYFANATGADDIVFTLDDYGKLKTSQWWGYYIDGLGWYEVYSSSYFSASIAAASAPYAAVNKYDASVVKSIVAPEQSSSLRSTVTGDITKVIAVPSHLGQDKVMKSQSSTPARQIKMNAAMIK